MIQATWSNASDLKTLRASGAAASDAATAGTPRRSSLGIERLGSAARGAIAREARLTTRDAIPSLRAPPACRYRDRPEVGPPSGPRPFQTSRTMLTTPALLVAVLPLLDPNGGGSGLEVEAPQLDETSLRSAVEGAEWWANLRWRYEHRSDDSRRGQPSPTTQPREEDMALKAALGIRTQTWNGMRGLLEFESVSDLGTRDEDLVVRGAEVNRVQRTI